MGSASSSLVTESVEKCYTKLALENHFEKLEHLDLNNIVDLEMYLTLLSNQLPNQPSTSISASTSSQNENNIIMIPTIYGKQTPLLFGLPKSLEKYSNFKKVEFGYHRIQTLRIPQNWKSLVVLNLQSNRLYELPQSLELLKNLEALDVSGNTIREISTKIHLPSLKKLNLSFNELQRISSEFILGLPSLKKLNLMNNMLEVLPLELGQLQDLEVLIAIFNRISNPPQDICNQGSGPLITYLRQQAPQTQIQNSNSNSTSTPNPANNLETNSKRATVQEKEGEDFIKNFVKNTSKDEENQNLNLNLRNKVFGCIFGAAIGDAIGLSCEFMSDDECIFHYELPLSYDGIFIDRHRCKWQKGDWTDDTDQMLCILEGILENKGKVDEKDFAKRLYEWSEKGFPELGDSCGWGLGKTIGSVVTQPNFLENPHDAAEKIWISSKSCSNGALMRTCILGIIDFENIEKVIENTKKICKVTHFDPKCIASCVLVTTFIALFLQEEKRIVNEENKIFLENGINGPLIENILEKAISFAKEELSSQEDQQEFEKYLVAENFEQLELNSSSSIGYTMKCLGSGIVGLKKILKSSSSFESIITELTLCGGDSDTNGTVCGALIGVLLGLNQLPNDWVQGLIHKNWLQKKVLQLSNLIGV